MFPHHKYTWHLPLNSLLCEMEPNSMNWVSIFCFAVLHLHLLRSSNFLILFFCVYLCSNWCSSGLVSKERCCCHSWRKPAQGWASACGCGTASGDVQELPGCDDWVVSWKAKGNTSFNTLLRRMLPILYWDWGLRIFVFFLWRILCTLCTYVWSSVAYYCVPS